MTENAAHLWLNLIPQNTKIESIIADNGKVTFLVEDEAAQRAFRALKDSAIDGELAKMIKEIFGEDDE